jgi:hypothetical protein
VTKNPVSTVRAKIRPHEHSPDFSINWPISRTLGALGGAPRLRVRRGDEDTKRAYESSDDAYRVFRKMLESGQPQATGINC